MTSKKHSELLTRAVEISDEKFARVCVVMDYLEGQSEFKQGRYKISETAPVESLLLIWDAVNASAREDDPIIGMNLINEAFRKCVEIGIIEEAR